MNFDPTLLETLVATLLTLLGAGAGAGLGVRRRRGDEEAEHSLTSQLATLTRQQTETTAKIAEVVTRLDRIVSSDLERIEERAQKHWRAHQRLAGDLDSVSDAVDIMVTHIGERLPELARRSIDSKLQRRQRHEITGLIPPAKR
jgi:hypothetical protein